MKTPPPKNIEIVKNNPFWSSVYQRVCFGHLSWFSVTIICCVWFGALQTERDVQVLLEAIKVSEIGQLAMQTSLRSISSTFGSWLGTKNGDGRKKIPLYMYQSFGKKKKRHWIWNMETWNLQFLTDSAKSSAPLYCSLLRSPSNFPGRAHTTPPAHAP